MQKVGNLTLTEVYMKSESLAICKLRGQTDAVPLSYCINNPTAQTVIKLSVLRNVCT